MKKKPIIVLSILTIGIIINLLTAVSNIYINMPTIIAANILGTALVGSFLGSFWGGLTGCISSLIWLYYGNGFSYMLIFAITPTLSGIISGIKCFKHLPIRILFKTMILVLIIPLSGYFISTIYFKPNITVFTGNFVNFVSLQYIDSFQNLFWSRFLTYGFSCLIADFIANITNKGEFQNEV